MIEEIENSDIQFFSEDIYLESPYNNLDLSSRYLGSTIELENNLMVLWEFKLSELNFSTSILEFTQDINLDQENNFFSSIRNFREFEIVINTCEDYTPPNQSGGNTGSPTPTKPPIIEYYFSGIDPITKKPASWKSTLKDSKRPPGATYDYIHVGLIDTGVSVL